MATEQGTLQRRRFTRYRTDLPLQAVIGISHEKYIVRGRCNTIAAGGLGGILSSELPVSDIAVLEVAIPPEQVQLRAVVRYRIGFQHGFEFISVSPAQLATIQRHCTGLPPA